MEYIVATRLQPVHLELSPNEITFLTVFTNSLANHITELCLPRLHLDFIRGYVRAARFIRGC